MSKYILETNELTKVFGKQKAVNNVSLKIEENSVYGLLGPNGAGKSTTLKMITGMLHKTSGEIMFEGHEWSRNDLSDIGALIEMPPLYENLSARENLKVRTLLLGLPDARIDEVLEIVDLKNTGKKKSGRWSVTFRSTDFHADRYHRASGVYLPVCGTAAVRYPLRICRSGIHADAYL